MFNEGAINQYPINYSTPTQVIVTDNIVFDGYGLQNGNVVTSLLSNDDLGGIDLNSFEYPRDNGGAVLSKYYRGREIKMTTTIKAPTAEAFNTILDAFKKGLSKTEGNLDITINGEVRRIKATVSAISYNRKAWNVTYCTADITFKTLEPFFYAVTEQTFTVTGKTVTFSEETTNLGTAESNPRFVFVFGTGSVTTEVAITAFSKTITITNSFATTDTLIVDCNTKSVKKNGTEIDYTGLFPSFPTGSNPFTVTLTGTTLVDVTVLTPKNYL